MSVTSVVLTQETQILHDQIGNGVDAFNHNAQDGAASLVWNLTMTPGVAALNAEVTRQAAIIAYVDDFKLLFVVSLAMLPLLLLMRSPEAAAPAKPALEPNLE